MTTSYDVIPRWVLTVVCLLSLLLILITLFYFIDDPKSIGLIGGLIGGLSVYIPNYISEKWAVRKIYEYQSVGIKNLLPNRHDRSYYRTILDGSSKDVKVMGASCSRFIDDFLDMDSDDDVLLDRMRTNRSLSIQLLIPDAEYMDENAKQRFTLASKKLAKLSEEFDERVQVRRFRHRANHSFLISDDDLVAGPIFDEERSRHAPAVHVSVSSAFGKKYFEHFQSVWNTAESA